MRRSDVLRPISLALALAAAAPADAPPRQVARYVLAESRKVVSAAGERASAVRGAVLVVDGAARWDLGTGTFPRSSAATLILGERGGWLVDREATVAARVAADDVASLFVPPAEGEPGPFQSAVRDLELAPVVSGPGPALDGRPTRRHRLEGSWVLVTSMPGRVTRIRSRLKAGVDLLEEDADAFLSPLDDPRRLLDLPPAVRAEVASVLASLRGFPVGILLEVESEQSTDAPGMGPLPSDGGRPLKVRVETARTVSGLEGRPPSPADAAALRLREETRVVGVERLVEPRETLR